MDIEFLEITRPIITFEEIIVETFNSKSTYGRNEWQPITAKVDGKYSKEVGMQMAKQVKAFEDYDENGRLDYKFDLKIDDLLLEGCFLQNVEYVAMDIINPGEIKHIELIIRYDNVTEITT